MIMCGKAGTVVHQSVAECEREYDSVWETVE